MNLSVVIPTLNGRERLGVCLNTLHDYAPDAETIVVNGPSADGTTGMIKSREDVDVLVETADRNANVARNVGVKLATGDAIALLPHDRLIDDSWTSAITNHLSASADAVSGPTQGADTPHTIPTLDRQEQRYNPENIAFTADAIKSVDGFDEYLSVGGMSDLCTRLQAEKYSIDWAPAMTVHSPYGTDGGMTDIDRFEQYRSATYQLLKNRGLGPVLTGQIIKDAVTDAAHAAQKIFSGRIDLTDWFKDGKDVIRGLFTGGKDGISARYRSSSRNHSGVSAATDHIVEVYDWR